MPGVMVLAGSTTITARYIYGIGRLVRTSNPPARGGPWARGLVTMCGDKVKDHHHVVVYAIGYDRDTYII